LSRTPSTNTITQSRANHQQLSARAHTTRSTQRPSISSPSPEERRQSAHIIAPPPVLSPEAAGSPAEPDFSSSSSSSGSDADLPTHRSQLFKRPPRFKSQHPERLSTFDEGDGTSESGTQRLNSQSNLPFATAPKKTFEDKYAHDTYFRASSKAEQKSLLGRAGAPSSSRSRPVEQRSQATTEAASPMTSSASTNEISAPNSDAKSVVSPPPNHRAELARLGSPRQRDSRPRREGSEGTPSMGSSFSDIDGELLTSVYARHCTDNTRCRYQPIRTRRSTA
jgi:hypothetical protein